MHFYARYAWCSLLMVLCFLAVSLAAQPVIGGTFDLANALTAKSERDFFYHMQGDVLLKVAARNQRVKSDLQVSFLPLGAEAEHPVQLKRAAVAFRLPLADSFLRFTLGKTRLAWGEGALFNAGDLLFGSSDVAVDLFSPQLRQQTAWLTAGQVPLGPLAFAEVVALPPRENTATIPWEQSSLGGRLWLQLDAVKLEGGYLYRGDAELLGYQRTVASHRAYLGVKTALGPVDGYLQSSFNAVPGENWQRNRRYLVFSLGAFSQATIDYHMTFHWLGELLLVPWGDWQPSSDWPKQNYGLLGFLELQLRSDALGVNLRSVISPVDGSALLSAGTDITLAQGLQLLLNVVGQLGEPTDIFAWQRPVLAASAPISLRLGLRYTF